MAIIALRSHPCFPVLTECADVTSVGSKFTYFHPGWLPDVAIVQTAPIFEVVLQIEYTVPIIGVRPLVVGFNAT